MALLPATSRSDGTSVTHWSMTYGQRVRNEQPLGRLMSEGGAPWIGLSRTFWPSTVDEVAAGIDSIRPLVYGWCGW